MVGNEFVDNCRRVLRVVRDFCVSVPKGIGADYISGHFEEEHDFRRLVLPAGVMLALVGFAANFVFGWYGGSLAEALQKGTFAMIDSFVRFVVYYFASLYVFEKIVCGWRFGLADADRKARAFSVVVMLSYFAVEAVVTVLPFLDIFRFLSLYLVYLAYCVADEYFGVPEKRVVHFLVWLVATYYVVLKLVGICVSKMMQYE